MFLRNSRSFLLTFLFFVGLTFVAPVTGLAQTKSVTAQRAVLDSYFGGTAITPSANVCIGLLTDSNTAAQRAAGTFTEVSGNAYARSCLTNNSTNFPAATGSSPASKSNAAVFTFPTPTPAGWGTVNGFCAFSASSGTTIHYCGSLGTPKVINPGDTVTFPASSLTFTEN